MDFAVDAAPLVKIWVLTKPLSHNIIRVINRLFYTNLVIVKFYIQILNPKISTKNPLLNSRKNNLKVKKKKKNDVLLCNKKNTHNEFITIRAQ